MILTTQLVRYILLLGTVFILCQLPHKPGGSKILGELKDFSHDGLTLLPGPLPRTCDH